MYKPVFPNLFYFTPLSLFNKVKFKKSYCEVVVDEL